MDKYITEFKLSFKPHPTYEDLGEMLNGRCVSYDRRDQLCKILKKTPDTFDEACAVVRLNRSDLNTLTIESACDEKVLQKMIVFLLTQLESQIGSIDATFIMIPKPSIVFSKKQLLLS